MSTYAQMLAQGRDLAKQEKAKKARGKPDTSMADSLLADLKNNPYSRAMPQAEHAQEHAADTWQYHPKSAEAPESGRGNPDPDAEVPHKPAGSLRAVQADTSNEQFERTVRTNCSNELSGALKCPDEQTNRTVQNSSNELSEQTHTDTSNEQFKRTHADSQNGHTRTIQSDTHEQFKRTHADSSNGHTRTVQTDTQIDNTLPDRTTERALELRTPAQKILARYLKKQGSHITTHALVCEETGLALGTLRRQLRTFAERGMISTEKHYGQGNRQGLRIMVVDIPDIPEQAMLMHKTDSSSGHTRTLQADTRERFKRTHTDTVNGQTRTDTDSSFEQFNRTVQPPLLDRKKESISLSNTEVQPDSVSPLVSLTAEDIAFYWPQLAAIDFGVSQIRQIFDRLQKQGRAIDSTLTDSVRQGLTHADAALDLAGGQLMDNKGNPVADPRAYVFRALARDGYYAAPKGYVSPEAQRLKDEAEQARLLAEAKKTLTLQQEAQKEAEQGAAYETWRNSLTEGEMDEIQSKAPTHARKGLSFEKWLKLSYFPEAVKK